MQDPKSNSAEIKTTDPETKMPAKSAAPENSKPAPANTPETKPEAKHA